MGGAVHGTGGARDFKLQRPPPPGKIRGEAEKLPLLARDS